MFSVTSKPTPVFNTKKLKQLFSLPFSLDKFGLLAEVEVVLYPYVTVTIKGDGDIVQVQTDDYPSSTPLFTHRHFLDQTNTLKPQKRIRPSTQAMIKSLQDMPNLPYVWGGNFPEGVKDLFELFKPKREMTTWEWQFYHLRGVDCSGLIYNVTHGTIPRNTGPLYKECNPIDFPSKPLDLIFTPGHVLIYLPQDKVIESRLYQGVTITNWPSRLREIELKDPWVKYGRLF